MSSRSLAYFDATQLIFQVFSSPSLTKHRNKPQAKSIHRNFLVGVGGVGSGDALGVSINHGCVPARHSLIMGLRGRVLFAYLEISYLEVR